MYPTFDELMIFSPWIGHQSSRKRWKRATTRSNQWEGVNSTFARPIDSCSLSIHFRLNKSKDLFS